MGQVANHDAGKFSASDEYIEMHSIIRLHIRLHPATSQHFQIAVLSALGNNGAGLSLKSGVYLMATNIQAALRAAALAGGFAIVTVTGCASVTTEQLDAVRATAEAAQNAANAAQRTATQAQQAASGAQSTANQALQAAQAAQACCDATNQRLDRMFEQSQAK